MELLRKYLQHHNLFARTTLILWLCLSGCYPSQEARKQGVPPLSVSVAPPVKRQDVPPITEITIEEDSGFTSKPPPCYSLTLRSDGTAIYVGAAFTKLKGTYRAVLPSAEFVRLARLIEDSRFDNFEPYYGAAPAFDISTVRVSVVRKGKRKTVLDCGMRNEAKVPRTLKQIEKQMKMTVANIAWVKISDKTDTPGYRPELTLDK